MLPEAFNSSIVVSVCGSILPQFTLKKSAYSDVRYVILMLVIRIERTPGEVMVGVNECVWYSSISIMDDGSY
jgi:hypothetical protein